MQDFKMRAATASVWLLCVAHAATAFVMRSPRAPHSTRSRLALALPDVSSSLTVLAPGGGGVESSVLVAETSTSELGFALVLPLIVYKLAATAQGYRLQPTLDYSIAGAVTVVVWRSPWRLRSESIRRMSMPN